LARVKPLAGFLKYDPSALTQVLVNRQEPGVTSNGYRVLGFVEKDPLLNGHHRG
jgi:hypothetical protein